MQERPAELSPWDFCAENRYPGFYTLSGEVFQFLCVKVSVSQKMQFSSFRQETDGGPSRRRISARRGRNPENRFPMGGKEAVRLMAFSFLYA